MAKHCARWDVIHRAQGGKLKTDYREALWAAGSPFPTPAASRNAKVANRCGLKIVLIAAHLWPVARRSPRGPAETIVD
jgi:hypothetical protein